MKDHSRVLANLATVTDFRNPFGYWCAPNGCTPEYMASHNFETFLSYGFIVCHVDQEDTSCRILPEDIVTMREQFLNTLENAVTLYEQLERGVKIGADAAEPRSYLPLLSDLEKDGCCVDWYLDMLDSDGDLCFALVWTGADDTAIWLSHETLDSEEKRKTALDLIAKARSLNRTVPTEATAA